MGVLQRFEQRLDSLVNGAFAKAFRSEVQPVEIAGALQRELDDKSVAVGTGRTVGPNTFTVELGPKDHDRLGPYAQPLGAELAAMVREHADAARVELLGPVEVELARAEDLGTGMFRVRSTTTPGVTAQPQRRPLHEPPPAEPAPPVDPAAQPLPPIAAGAPGAPVELPADLSAGTPPAAAPAAPVAPAHPRLVVHGTAYPLSKAIVSIGRGADVDIRIDDPGVSRHHANFHVGDRCSVVDLASTNGTWIADQRISEAALADGDEIRVGSTTLVFRAG